MYVVATGNPFDGIKLYGPFETVDHAIAWAESAIEHEDWHVVRLEKLI